MEQLIAEAWDSGGLYQVGSFPHWGVWSEWNGQVLLLQISTICAVQKLWSFFTHLHFCRSSALIWRYMCSFGMQSVYLSRVQREWLACLLNVSVAPLICIRSVFKSIHLALMYFKFLTF